MILIKYRLRLTNTELRNPSDPNSPFSVQTDHLHFLYHLFFQMSSSKFPLSLFQAGIR
jgi:hypothetical protein